MLCGINGIISHEKDLIPTLLKAQKIQCHRGPDSEGIFQYQINNYWTVGLGHQRLSILDLSEAGNQPMASCIGNYRIVYNGEIYNYKEIRYELEQMGYFFKSNTDTEVILVALHHWGINGALSRFNGMWAFVWFDIDNKRLVLSRDRMGIKPLHIFLENNQLIFASELKTILEMANHRFSLNYQIIGEYLLQSLAEISSKTFFLGVEKIPPGHYAIIDLTQEHLNVKIKSYWELNYQRMENLSDENEIELIRELFFDSVKLRLRSDVPLGVLLSGGVDSSSIATVMKKILGESNKIEMISAVSNDSRYDETPYIDIMSKYLGQPVHKVLLDFSPEKAFNYLEKVCWFNDEPAGSFSNVAHYLLMEKAKELNVTVILSGQGADELLCGYRKYLGFYLQYLINQSQYSKTINVFYSFLKRGTILNHNLFADAKRYLPNFIRFIELDIRGSSLKSFIPKFVGLNPADNVQDRQKIDLQYYSLPSLLHYEDRMSMAWSREIRVPFLDYRLVEKLISLPVDMKLRDGWTKYIFRKAITPFLPKEIVWRKDKRGFINPQREWLKHELKPLMQNYIEDESCFIYKYHIIDKKKLTAKYLLYCKQPPNRGMVFFRDIFNPISFEIWFRKFEQYIS